MNSYTHINIYEHHLLWAQSNNLLQSTTIFKNYPLIGVTYLKTGFNKSLKNIKNTDKMVYTNEENTLTEITSESVSQGENKLYPLFRKIPSFLREFGGGGLNQGVSPEKSSTSDISYFTMPIIHHKKNSLIISFSPVQLLLIDTFTQCLFILETQLRFLKL